MIGIIFTECWADDNDVVKMIIILVFNQLLNKVGLSTPRLANEYACMRFLNITRHSFFYLMLVLSMDNIVVYAGGEYIKMNVLPAYYSCGNRTTKVKNEYCKMRKPATSVNPKFQDWCDESVLAYHGVQSVLQKERFTCDENGRLPCQKIPLIEDLLTIVNISHAQKKLPTWFMRGHKILQNEKCLQIILKGWHTLLG